MPAISEFDCRYNMLIKTFAQRPEPAFETPGERIAALGRTQGCDDDVGQLRLVLMHRPGDGDRRCREEHPRPQCLRRPGHRLALARRGDPGFRREVGRT